MGCSALRIMASGMEGAVAKLMSATHMGMREKPSRTAAPGMGISSAATASCRRRMVVKS